MIEEANIIFVDSREFAFQIFAEETHQEIHFGLGAAPIFEREGVESEARELEAGAGFDDFAGGFYSGAVSGDAREMTALRPAAVAVHDDGEVLGEALEIKFIEKLRFFAVGGFEKFAGFHSVSLEDRQ